MCTDCLQAKERMDDLEAKGVLYGGVESYHKMCRCGPKCKLDVKDANLSMVKHTKGDWGMNNISELLICMERPMTGVSVFKILSHCCTYMFPLGDADSPR